MTASTNGTWLTVFTQQGICPFRSALCTFAMSHLPRDFLPLPPAFQGAPVTRYADALIAFSTKYKWLANIHIVNFLTMAQWDMIDPEWREALLRDDVGYGELMRLASFSECMESWPDSFKQFVQEALDLALLREMPVDSDRDFVTSIDKRILPGMNDKKLHEVEILSGLIAKISKDVDVSSVIDLGSGQGYLSRALAYQHDLHVLAIDSCSVQTCGAQKFQDKAEKALGKNQKRKQPSASTQAPAHENDPETTSTSQEPTSDNIPSRNSNLHHIMQEVTLSSLPTLLTEWSTSSFWSQTSIDTRTRWLLCGLHACGDLSSHIIRLFLGSDDVRCLVSVGCCYHILSEGLEDEGTTEPRFAFPMSQYFQRAQFSMGGTARMLACQAPSRWSERQESSVEAFEHHFFRALLQHIMVEKGLATVSNPPILGRLNKKRDFLSFETYCAAALRRLKLPPDSITAEDAREYYTEFRLRGTDRQIAAFWTLRALLGPVLESVVLVDRWCAVREGLGLGLDGAEEAMSVRGKAVWMWPLFDWVTSPRNVVIVAIK